MEIFDGFISAVAAEFKIPFHKGKNGSYTATLEFDNGRSQEIVISLKKDEAGDRAIKYRSVVTTIKQDKMEFYKFCLEQNLTFDYGALALDGKTLIVSDSVLLEDCEPRRFIKNLVYIAAKADEMEEIIMRVDAN